MLNLKSAVTGREGALGMGLVASSVVLSSAIQATSKVLLESIDSLYLLFMGQIVAAAFMAMLYGVVRSFPELRRLGSRRLVAFLAVTVLGGLAAPLMLFEGLKLTTATNAVLVGRTESVLTFVAGGWLLRESLTRHQWIGAGLVLAGSILVVLTAGGARAGSIGTGDLLVFGSAAAWAVGTVIYRAFLCDAPTKVLVLYRNLVGAMLCLALGLVLFGAGHLAVVFRGDKIVFVIAYAVGIMTLSQLFWYKGVSLVAISSASALTLAAPFTGALFAVLLLGETISMGQILGGVLIVLGMAVGLRRLPVQRGHRGVLQWRCGG